MYQTLPADRVYDAFQRVAVWDNHRKSFIVDIPSLLSFMNGEPVRSYFKDDQLLEMLRYICQQQDTCSYDEFQTFIQQVATEETRMRSMAPTKPKYIDVCFLLDITDSMQPWITLSKQCIQRIIDEMKKTGSQCVIRYGFVGYRDKTDQEPYTFQPFCVDASHVVTKLEGCQASGGDDFAEDVDEGLNVVLAMDWVSCTRVLIHIADAPGHGNHMHDFGPQYDYYYEHSSSQQTLNLLLSLVEKKIDYTFFQIGPYTEKMTTLFRNQMEQYNEKNSSPKYVLSLDNLSNSIEDTEFLKKITERIKQAQDNSALRISNSEMAKQLIRNVNLNALDDIEWERVKQLPPRKGKTITFLYPFKNMNGKSPREFWEQFSSSSSPKYQCHQVPISIAIDTEKYGEGAQRTSYRAFDKGWGVKLLVKKCHSCRSIEEEIATCKEVVEDQYVSKVMADIFNSKTDIVKIGLKVLEIQLLVFTDANDDISEIYTLESFIEGEYIKYFDNLGNNVFYDNVCTDINSKNAHEVAQAFSHWTYEASGQQMLVSDIQGVGYLITDPAIITNYGCRSLTDMGRQSIENFFSSHVCNTLCKNLGLTSQYGCQTLYLPMNTNIPRGVSFYRFCSGYGCTNFKPFKAGDALGVREYVTYCDKCEKLTSIKAENQHCKVPGCPLKFYVDIWFWHSVGKRPPTKCPYHRGNPRIEKDWVKENRLPYDARFTLEEFHKYLEKEKSKKKPQFSEKVKNTECRSLLVSNLPSDINDNTIRRMFGYSCTMYPFRKNAIIVEFKTEQEQLEKLGLQGHIVGRRILQVEQYFGELPSKRLFLKCKSDSVDMLKEYFSRYQVTPKYIIKEVGVFIQFSSIEEACRFVKQKPFGKEPFLFSRPKEKSLKHNKHNDGGHNLNVMCRAESNFLQYQDPGYY
ncbi:hypothetical protein C9374_010400 [Naegleria lovaniensis]|uniref:Alpha-type protein kinase domain-containing protein n=1 Tax=Naegleria lovaniensis TaxID=51637 RepID=A0AA88KE95_NAELO|nr:uncharacterized protein C9374_010400 [Naegleria lovaniensis]KAG2374823.1 hypothetical protein C9374_010400 [Naegleria lovaniensis]